MAKKLSFVAAMKDYFNGTPSLFTGKPIDQTPTAFLQEMKKLTDADKEWFRANLSNVGYEIAAVV